MRRSIFDGALMIPRDPAQFTPLLRSGQDPLWVRMRDLLVHRGFDPSTLMLTWCCPDDVGLEMGEIVTSDLRAFEFEFRYEEGAVENGELIVWKEVSHLPKGKRHLHRNEG